MKKKLLSIIMLMAMCVSLLASCGDAGTGNTGNTGRTGNTGNAGNSEEVYKAELPTEMVETDIFVTPVEGISDDFIKGMDVSSVLAQEASGVKYYNQNGEEEDLFKILADAGINYIRVRVWNDPFDENGKGYGGGNCDVNTAAEIGKRAAKYGMKLLVDFHYSDFWADPAKQMAPKAWRTMLMINEKEAAIYEYTKESLNKIIEAGADVGMVQIGNEINNGLAGEKSVVSICKLLSSASKAVREVSTDIKVVVHYTEIDKVGDMEKKAQQLVDNGVDYDVFGVSYYPYWHGTLENLTSVLTNIKEKFGKETCVVETGYMFTGDDGDMFGNSVSAGDALDAYPPTVQGQATCIRDICAAAVAGDAMGVFYWEGAWTPVGSEYEANKVLWEEHGSGWASSYSVDYDPDDAGQWYGGCSWDNQAMFDFNSKALSSLNVWKYLKYGAKAAEVEVLSVIAPIVEVECRTELVMPETVTAIYNDPTCTDPLKVTWDADQLAKVDLTVPGKYEINGTTEKGGAITASLKVYNLNLLKDYSFEEQNADAWKFVYLNGATEGVDFEKKAADAISGEIECHFWNTAAQEFKVEQTITGVAAGKYSATAYIQGGDVGDHVVNLYVIVGDKKYESEAIVLEGWVVWKNPLIKDIVVDATTDVTVGMYVKCAGGGWGTMDDFEFYSQE